MSVGREMVNNMDCKLIAFDLDGTLLNDDKEVSAINREAILRAHRQGVVVTIATGRVWRSIPKEVSSVEGISYAITSNGAHVSDFSTGEILYSNYLSPKAVDRMIELTVRDGLLIEVFCGGRAYVEEKLYGEIIRGERFPERSEYVLNTRRPSDDIIGLLRENREEIENINVFFEDMGERERYRSVLLDIPEATITNSMPNNYEVGGVTTSKGDGLRALAEMLGICRENIMCFGDAPNDIPMIDYAGMGVAMANSIGDTKEHADHVCGTNNDSGVGRTIEEYALKG